MTLPVLLSVSPGEARAFGPAIAEACAAAGVPVAFVGPDAARDAIYAIVTPAGPVEDFSACLRLKAALSLWAGVERVVGNPTLRVPLARMVDPGLTAGMVEYVTGHVLRHHLGLDAIVSGQDGVWRHDRVPPLAAERRVGVLGLGALGGACARALAALGFAVHGWSRRPAEIAGVVCRTGPDGLDETLSVSDILVTLLPATPATEGIIDCARLCRLPKGAVLINPGRGTLIDEAALLACLDRGRIAHATLDVFPVEPLPPALPFWSHHQVTVTPHIAAATRPATAAPVIAENIRRREAGEPLLHLVDRTSGY